MANTKFDRSAASGDEVHSFRDLMAAISNHQTALAERLGLNLTEFRCLTYIDRYNALAPRTLAEQMQVSRPTISRILDRLVALDLISCEPNLKDRRSLKLVATEKASSQLEKLHAPVSAAVTKLYGKYTGEQCRAILDHLRNSIELLNREAEKVRSRKSTRD